MSQSRLCHRIVLFEVWSLLTALRKVTRPDPPRRKKCLITQPRPRDGFVPVPLAQAAAVAACRAPEGPRVIDQAVSEM